MKGCVDLVVKLREIRRFRGMTQKQLARRSGVGDKTVSSFETGQRIESLKIGQLRALLEVLGIDEATFFDKDIDQLVGAVDLGDRGARALNWYARQFLHLLVAARRDGIAAESVIEAAREISNGRRAASSLRRAS